MYWYLLLAHLLADYPLQSDKLVQRKRQFDGLLLHVTIHAALVFLVGALFIRQAVALIVVLVFILHLAVDFSKNKLSKRFPNQVFQLYMLDQVLHALSLLIIVFVVDAIVNEQIQSGGNWVFVVIGFLLSTHVWFITERVLQRNDASKVTAINQTMWARLLVRATVYMVGLSMMSLNLTTIMTIGVGGVLVAKMMGQPLRTDLIVALSVAAWVRIMLLFLH